MRIRLATAGDAAAIATIYAPYVTGTAISFEVDPPDPAEIGARIATGAGRYPWLVACDEAGEMLGYAAAGAFRTRPAYRFTVESSVYLAPAAIGRGAGRLLYRTLLETLTAQGFTQAIGAITLPNAASVKLHEALGFSRAGTYRQVGYKLGGWHSVGLWQRMLAPPADPPADPKPVAAVWPGES